MMKLINIYYPNKNIIQKHDLIDNKYSAAELSNLCKISKNINNLKLLLKNN